MSAPPLALADLDRAELLQLIQEKLSYQLRPADLWRVRWGVLARRALEARQYELDAFTAYVEACGPPPEVAPGARPSFVDYLAVREERRKERERADRAAKRAEALRDTAWAALEACHCKEATS